MITTANVAREIGHCDACATQALMFRVYATTAGAPVLSFAERLAEARASIQRVLAGIPVNSAFALVGELERDYRTNCQPTSDL